MIELKRRQDCCGCTACVSVCPQHCITMQEDREGFLYPVTDTGVCTGCNACNRVCPVINKTGESRTSFPSTSKAYAAAVTDGDILLNSSSGGLFSAIASRTIQKGGIVYGAAWQEGEVRHVAVETADGLARLRGSKYVQSRLGGTFAGIRRHLRAGRKVLFSGTPCQAAGLRNFLCKDYDNIVAVEVACHGAPSPKVLRKYMQTLQKQYGDGVQLNFRSKPDGWEQYKVTAYTGGTHLFYEGQKENLFMKGFLRELYSRPICHECPFKAGASGADFTLADFWGIKEVLPDFPSYNGASLVLTHSHKAEDIIHDLDGVIWESVDLGEAVFGNKAMLDCEKPHPERAYFFRQLNRKPFVPLMCKCLDLRPTTKLKLRMRAYLKRIGLWNTI